MARFHKLVPTVPYPTAQTVYLGADANNKFTPADVNKFVKLVGDSRYDLCAAGDDIQRQVVSVEQAPDNGSTIGGVAVHQTGQMMFVTADGLQATPGTGAIAVGDIVVCGTVVARNTALSGWPKVCKATTPANVVHKWRVVALSDANSGAVGQRLTIERF